MFHTDTALNGPRDSPANSFVRIAPLMAGAVVALLVACGARPAHAHPNMIRLGYPTCASCHVSPQGGGVLTRYGRGIDYAQTLRAGEPPDAELPADALMRLLYDVRVQMFVDHWDNASNEYSFIGTLRSAVALNRQNHVVYSFGIRSPTMTVNRRMGAATRSISSLYWMYQPTDGLALVVGRDELPTGLGLPTASAFYKTVNDPNTSATPTQAKVFWWNKRWQVATYAYGPDGNETQPQFEARGAGAMVGMNLSDRAVVGVTTRLSKSDAFDRRNAGFFARIGFTEHVGVLAEHDVTERVLITGPRVTHLAGHAEVFFIPLDWFRTALGVEHLNTRNGTSTYRLSPSAEVRLTPNLKTVFSTRSVYADIDSRTYSVMLQVKAQ